MNAFYCMELTELERAKEDLDRIKSEIKRNSSRRRKEIQVVKESMGAGGVWFFRGVQSMLDDGWEPCGGMHVMPGDCQIPQKQMAMTRELKLGQMTGEESQRLHNAQQHYDVEICRGMTDAFCKEYYRRKKLRETFWGRVKLWFLGVIGR